MRIGIQAIALQGADDFRRAGIARYAYCIIDELLRIGDEHEFRIFVSPDFDPPKEWTSRPNVKIHRRWKRQRLWMVIVGGIAAKLWGLKVWFSVANEMPPLGFVKRVIFMHDLFPLRRPEFYHDGELQFYRSNFTFCCQNADLILTNSKSTKRDIMEMFGTGDERIRVTYLGPGNLVERLESVTSSQVRGTGVQFERFLFTLGTLEPRKNLSALIEAFAQVQDPTVGLVIGGGRGWKEGPIFDRVRELGLEDRVQFLGYVADEDLPILFAACEAFVYPSIDEGFGIPVLEAMLLGAPVLSSNAGALSEVGGECVRYFDPNDASGMATLINMALSRPDERPVWVNKGLQQASKFSWRRCADETLSALVALAGK